MTGEYWDREPDEHIRWARYLTEFAEASSQDVAALIARVLTDPDTAMANSAVREYLDGRAAALLTDPGYPAWRDEMTGPVAAGEFVSRRLREWTLLRAVTLDEPWDAEELLAASNWCQLHAAQTATVGTVVAALAEGGRTRRIRNAAKLRLPG
ncbi:hypothetical protein ACFYST_33850 [Kitasatospora sp. NPDC004614]|uniref:hypothetical protein n=1 Tax=unclassified Kitasatospora TaxID=2633591 RepID=UPI0036CBC113